MQEFIEVLKSAAKDLFSVDIEPELTRPDEQFGDFATNIALQLGGKLHKNPREIAVALAGKLHGQEGIAEVNIAGPGFINIKLSDRALIGIMDASPTKTYEGKTVVAEYSDPNPFKVLHAGHLYTTLVGDAIANLIENAGGNVHRVNFGGDVGLHVGKTMWAIIRELGAENAEKLQEVDKNKRLEWISEQYIKGNSAYDEDESAKAEIKEVNKRVYQLHDQNDHGSGFAQIYWACRQWSYEGFEKLYKQLQVMPFEKYYPESSTTSLCLKIVKEQQEKGVFEESDGAVVYKGEKDGLHTRVFITSAGLPTYEAKDLGLAITKWQDYHFDESIIITANDITEYMKVVFAALSHFQPELPKRTRHLTHGIVKLKGGVKMSSRKGNILRAADILEAAAEANKKATGNEDVGVTLGAIKYAFLKNRIGGDIIYDPEESVSLEGNSGPYLQYAYARASSILSKSESKSAEPLSKLETEERALVRKIGEYAEVVEKATNELMPHHIATFLYELAQVFNRFYEKSRVIGDPREQTRIKLVGSYAEVLKKGLGLLGITAPDKM
jgi:arginyl-tRNA synthetase